MKFDTKINAILVISQLMASDGKVLIHFRCHGEKFTKDLLIVYPKNFPSFWYDVKAVVNALIWKDFSQKCQKCQK